MSRSSWAYGKLRFGFGIGLLVALGVGLVLARSGGDTVDRSATGSTTPRATTAETTAATVLGTIVERSESPAAPVAPVPPSETTAPPETAAPEAPVPNTTTVTADVQGDERFTSVTVRLEGPAGGVVELGPSGGRAEFTGVEPGQYELHLDYAYGASGPADGASVGTAHGVDRSAPFALEPGRSLYATWSQPDGWTLTLG